MKSPRAVLVRVAVIAGLLSLGACEVPGDTVDESTATETKRLTAEAVAQAGMPAIVNFTERKFAKMILELRDQEIQTWAYFVDMNGGLHLICEAVGYGLPYSTQYTNPERVLQYDEYPGSGPGGTIAQPEPNGLFTPDGLAATWVLCSDGQGGMRPVYSEPELLVSPFPLTETATP